MGRMRKEAVVAYFKIPSQHLPGGTKKSTKTFRIAIFSAEIRKQDLRNIKAGLLSVQS
jgi:hypothetical protein